MGNNVFQSPFNITSTAINAALANSGLSLPGGAVGAPSLNFGTPLTGFYSSSSGRIDVAINGQNRMRLTSDLSLGSAGAVAWSSGTSIGVADVSLSREAAGVLALNGGDSPQAFRLYNTYTDGSNYELGTVSWLTNNLQIGTQSAGTGTLRPVFLVAGVGLANASFLGIDPTTGVTAGKNSTNIATLFTVASTSMVSTAILAARLTPAINQASGTYTVLDINPTETSIGAGPHYYLRARRGGGSDDFSVQRNGDLFCGGVTIGGGNVLTMSERVDPGNSAADQGRVYLRDNGSGKTQLCVVFSSGAVQVLATQP